MKKLFLLALVFLMICGSLFAAEDAVNAKERRATITLNLSGAKSVVNLGFIESINVEDVDLNKITSAEFTGSAPLATLNIGLNENTLETNSGSFAIWYFFNAVNKDSSGIALTLNVSPFTSDTEKVGFTMSNNGVKYNDGSQQPTTSAKYTVPADRDLSIKFFENNKVSGVHKGYIGFTVDSFNYSGVKTLDYVSHLTLSITAP